MLPCLDYSKQCCNEEWGECLSELWLSKYGIAGSYGDSGASLVAQLVKNLPAMQETLV